ncbi:poliovirus receptor homolog isoform 1-T1 [Odontesthes bonariensis]|uniref:poliovirus receptor homolog isoform X1 n=1 Tax=Odontesthes bonariensis TaxID=219752 RepID=UPI003F582F26
MYQLLFWTSTLISSSWSEALATGGRATGVFGESAILSCKLGDTTETLTQISWQRRTKENPVNDNFYIIESTNKALFVNGGDDRFQFLGNFGAKDGTIQLSNITLKDEGSYTCIFTLFPSGNHRTEIPLAVLVPPATSLKDEVLVLGDKEAPIASCMAAGSKPPAVVRWITTNLGEEVRNTTNTTQHENGTTTVVSSLFGKPTMEINGGSVLCVVTSEAQREEKILNLTIQLNSLATGGRATGVFGESAILSCKLGDTTETLTQISWQRRTKEKPVNDNFYIIESTNKALFVNGGDDRFQFLGNFGAKDGTIQLSNITLKDEGSYTCIFTLFPSGNHRTEIPLAVLVPPATSLKDEVLVLGDEEAPIASCMAEGSKPPAVVRWITTNLGEEVRNTTNTTQHENGTTTVVSSLFGKPTMEINGGSVLCVVTSEAQREEKILNLTIQLNFSPSEVHISEESTDSFRCISKAYPVAKVTWSRPGQSLPQSVRVEGERLHLSSKTSDLTGLYQCEAENPYGRTITYLHMHISSGGSTAGWVLFGLLLSINLVVLVWKCYKYRKRLRREDDGGQQANPTSPGEDPAEGVPLAEDQI